MMRFITPILLCAVAIGLFIVFTNPTYQEVKNLREEQKSYDEALVNSRKLLEKRDELTLQYNNFSVEDRDKLTKLMPDNVDNIRLIIDIQKIASQYGMLPRDIKFDTASKQTVSNNGIQTVTPDQVNQNKKDYGSFDLEFSLIGTYENFVKFTRDLEHSLRIVDITGVNFGVEDPKNTLRFTIKTKTYWLKN